MDIYTGELDKDFVQINPQNNFLELIRKTSFRRGHSFLSEANGWFRDALLFCPSVPRASRSLHPQVSQSIRSIKRSFYFKQHSQNIRNVFIIPSWARNEEHLHPWPHQTNHGKQSLNPFHCVLYTMMLLSAECMSNFA